MLFFYKYSIIVSFLTVSLDVYARAGGGGGKGSGEGTAISAAVAGLLYAIYRIRRARMIIQAKKQFQKANKDDSSWNLAHFKQSAGNIFYKYQKAWMEKDLISLEREFHPSYLRKSQKTLDETLKGKINILKDIDLTDIELMSVLDIQGQEGDMFVLELKFKLIDYTINEKTRKFISSPLSRGDKESKQAWIERAQTKQDKVIEYWVFIRTNGKWLLYNIHQVKSFFGDLGHASVSKLRKILAEEQAKPDDAPVDDSFFYNKNE